MSLAYAMVRHRFAGFAGTFAAIAVGVALVCGATTLYLSSTPRTPARYDAAAVLVRSPAVGDDTSGYPEYRSWTTADASRLTARLAALPGVALAAADPVFYVQRLAGGRAVGDPSAALLDGHAWSSAALGGYRLTAGAPPARAGEVALNGFAPGTSVEVLTAAGPATWTVTGTLDGPGFYVADDAARAMSSGVRVIGLVVTGSPSAVAAAARRAVGGEGTVLSGSARDTLEPESVTRNRWLGAQLLIAMVTLGLFVAVFVVAATCALSAAQRRREIGLLRAVGATPGQVRRLMYAETLVVAALAGLVGVPLGALTAPLLAGPLIDTGLEPPVYTVTAQPLVWAGSFALGIVVALAGVASAARRSSRVPALDALRDAAVERRAMSAARWVSGLLGAGGGVALLAALPSLPVTTRTTAGLGAAMLLLTAAALLAPVVIVPLVRALTWPWRTAATGMLVREGTLTGVRRVASTAAPVLLAVGFTVLLAGTVFTIDGVTGASEAAKIPAALVAAPDGTPGLSEAAVRVQPGVSPLPTRVLITRGAVTTGYAASGVSDAADGLTLSPETAKALHAVKGTVLALRFADGTTARLPVTAVSGSESSIGDAPVVLPRALARAHDPAALTTAVLLHGRAVPAPGVREMTARAYVQEDADDEGRLVELFLWVLIGLAVGYTGLAVANTLLMATAARRPEFHALRLAGGATAQILRVTTAEALLAVLVGTLLGAAVAAVALTGVQHAVEAELSMPVPIVIPWAAATTVTAACALVALAATALPVLRRRQPA